MARPKTFARASSLPATEVEALGDRSLDPSDWSQFREVAHWALDVALEHVETARDRPVWQPVPENIKRALAAPLPIAGQNIAEALSEFCTHVLPYSNGNTHPRFFGWVHGSGTPIGIIAEMLAGAFNANSGGRDHGAIYVEKQVIDWCRQLFGFPTEASGLLVSGTSMATLIGLAVARNARCGKEFRRQGLSGRERLVGYTSAEAHASVAKAFELLGLGRDALRKVPVRSDFTLNTAALEEAIRHDRYMGFDPFAVIATAGTVNTGAIDDIAAAADIAKRENLWLHVDGAFGALAILDDELKPRLAGIERAHSLAFDFHKWLHVPYDAGCILVRDGAAHLATFSSRPDYLAGAERGLAAGEPWFCEYGPELSRGFRALKVWLTLKTYGTQLLGAKIADNCRQAAHLGAAVDRHPCLELMAPVPLNIVCFRYRPPSTDRSTLDSLNREIVIELQERGIAAPSTTTIDGALAIRVNLTNHRTTEADLDLLLSAILAIGDELTKRTPVAVVEHSAVLERLLALAEIAPIAREVTVRAARGLQLPFRVRADAIELDAEFLASEPAGRILLRHALELKLLMSLPGAHENEARIARALAASRVAALDLAIRPSFEREEALAALPSWLSRIYTQLGQNSGWADLGALLAPGTDMIARLLALSGDDPSDARNTSSNVRARTAASHLLAEVAPVACPVELLLTTGGDSRLALDPATGANPYGACPRPYAGELSFSSCTATSVSELGYAAAEALRRRLLAAAVSGRLQETTALEAEKIRRCILERLFTHRPAGTQAVLTASGTDATIATVAIARAGGHQPLLSVVIGPDETGSGVPLAASGQHFSARTTLGHEVKAGDPIPGLDNPPVETDTVHIRSDTGQARPLRQIDAEVTAKVAAAIEGGRRVLLFVLDSGKTGMGAPSIACLRRLIAQHGAALDVVIDACQARLAPRALAAYLDLGALVQVTGSKFYCGAPFAGALILPPAIAARINAGMRLPVGCAAYATRPEWPREADAATAHLPEAANLGLLFRWTTALAELDAFAEMPAGLATRRLRQFARAVQASFGVHPELEMLDAPLLDRAQLGPRDPWAKVPTIFSFKLMRGGAALSMDEARIVHRLLLRDISDRLPESASAEDRRIAAKRCHLGQPVKVRTDGGQPAGALRLCASSRLVTAPASQAIEGARIALAKAALIVRHFDSLAHAPGA